MKNLEAIHSSICALNNSRNFTVGRLRKQVYMQKPTSDFLHSVSLSLVLMHFPCRRFNNPKQCRTLFHGIQIGNTSFNFFRALNLVYQSNTITITCFMGGYSFNVNAGQIFIALPVHNHLQIYKQLM